MIALEGKLLKDGSGRACVHYFARDEAAATETPKKTIRTNLGDVHIGGTKGYIACRRAVPQNAKPPLGATPIHLDTTDDPRAVTCPECQKSEAFRRHVELLVQALSDKGEVVTSTE